MADERTDRILDAVYACFARHGVRRTTMDDIAAAADMSRPAVYQYVRNKDDAFRRLATRIFDEALAGAQAAAARSEERGTEGRLADRLHAVLSTKLELALKLWQDTPHAAELLDEGARLSGDIVESFTKSITDLLAEAVAGAAAAGEVDLRGAEPAEIAGVTLALLRGLEADFTDPERLRRQLRLGIDLLVAGLRRR